MICNGCHLVGSSGSFNQQCMIVEENIVQVPSSMQVQGLEW
jgi:hypothetical protein